MSENKWISVEDTLPVDGKEVLVLCCDKYGERITIAAHVSKFSFTSEEYWSSDNDLDEDFFDYKNGVEFVPEGWFESCYTNETDYKIEKITHWKKLPEKPNQR
jgi:hypothetical protein